MSDQDDNQEIDFNDPKIQAYVEEQVKGLKAKNSELLGSLKQTKTDFDTFKASFDGVDIEAIKSIAEKAKQDDITKKLAEGKIDEVIAQKTDLMRQDFEQKLNVSESRAKTLESKVLNGYIASAAAQAGVLPEAIELVSLLASSQFRLDEHGDPVAVNANGEVINGKDGKTPLSLTEWLAGVREAKPLLWGTAQGSGAPGSKSKGQIDITKPDGSVNLTKLSQLRNENPQLAKELAAKHGIKLN